MDRSGVAVSRRSGSRVGSGRSNGTNGTALLASECERRNLGKVKSREMVYEVSVWW
jgi:hypothetical protein